MVGIVAEATGRYRAFGTFDGLQAEPSGLVFIATNPEPFP